LDHTNNKALHREVRAHHPAAARAHGHRESIGAAARAGGHKGLAEEQAAAYKDVDQVVEVVHKAGISRKVARLRRVGVIKG
jgi:tRNA-splicing ligase RtcB